MKHATYTIAVALFHCTASATPSPVAFESPCSCRGEHAKGRLSAKNDPALPTADARPMQAVTPSDIYSWPGADAQLMCQSERTGIENMWFTLTGRVLNVRIEMDGDLHIALQMRQASGPAPLSPKYRQNRNGATCAKRFSAGCGRGFHFTQIQREPEPE